MRKIILMLMLVGVFFIAGCEDDPMDDSLNCDKNQVEENGVCVDKTPEPLDCEDDEEEVDGECVDIEEEDPILTTEDKFDSYVEKVQTYFDTQNRISTRVELEMFMYTSEGIFFDSTIRVDSNYNENLNYYYEDVLFKTSLNVRLSFFLLFSTRCRKIVNISIKVIMLLCYCIIL